MFQRMASSFDESSTAGVFLSVLFSESSRCQLLFPSYLTLLRSGPSDRPPPPQNVPASPFLRKHERRPDVAAPHVALLSPSACFAARVSWTAAFPGEMLHLPLPAGLLLHQLEPGAGQTLSLPPVFWFTTASDARLSSQATNQLLERLKQGDHAFDVNAEPEDDDCPDFDADFEEGDCEDGAEEHKDGCEASGSRKTR